MATTTITNNLLNGLRSHIVSMVSHGQYKIGSTWYRADLNSAEVQSNGAVHLTFYIEQQDSAATPATEFRLCDSDGTVLVDRVESISFAQHVEKILVRFKLGVSVGSST